MQYRGREMTADAKALPGNVSSIDRYSFLHLAESTTEDRKLSGRRSFCTGSPAEVSSSCPSRSLAGPARSGCGQDPRGGRSGRRVRVPLSQQECRGDAERSLETWRSDIR